MKAKEGPTEPTEPSKPTEPGKPTEPTEPSESANDKTEVPHGQHGGRQNQHGLSATGASRSAGWSCCWPSLTAWYSSAGGVVCRPCTDAANRESYVGHPI